VPSSLSYLQLYLTLAQIARRFDMELHETTKQNVEVGRDFAIPFPEKKPYFVKAKVTQVADQ
jgi:hypothetical protein